MVSGMRGTGGLFLQTEEVRLVIDPGPGALAALHQYDIDPWGLDGILITHLHMDHVGDANVLLEAATSGGHKKHGVLAAPLEALEGPQRVIYRYRRPFLKEVVVWEENKVVQIGDVQVEAVARYLHGGLETFRLHFTVGEKKVALFTDGATTTGARRMAGADIAILHCLLPIPLPSIDHLDPTLCAQILQETKPSQSFLTHFGSGILKKKISEQIAHTCEKETGVPCLAARDGLIVPL